MSNLFLNRAKANKMDEFYTTYECVKDELRHYHLDLRDKRIHLPCDTEDSNFYKYLKDCYKQIGFKELIATSIHTKDALVFRDGIESVIPLKDFGDFRSDEVREIMRGCDVVITNPPFSLLRDFITQIISLHKRFIVIGNINSVMTKQVFDLYLQSTFYTGFTNSYSGHIRFETPYDLKDSKDVKFEDGKKYISLGLARWFQNIKPIPTRKLTFTDKSLTDYKTVDGTDIINVDSIRDVPQGVKRAYVPISIFPYIDGYTIKAVALGNCPKINGKKIYKRVLIEINN